MTTEYYVPEWMLKSAAKQLSRHIDITHSEALDEFAFELGFRNLISKISEKIASIVEAELTEADSS